jgi:hypothetical protein
MWYVCYIRDGSCSAGLGVSFAPLDVTIKTIHVHQRGTSCVYVLYTLFRLTQYKNRGRVILYRFFAQSPLSSSPPKASSHSRPRTNSVSSITSRTEKGKERKRDRDRKDNRELILQEYRKYGRWDGWG